MLLRAPSELSLHVFVSSFDDRLDEDDDVLLPLPSSPLLILRMFEFSIVKFLFFFCWFVILFAQIPRKELYSSPSGCRSKRGGNAEPSNRGLIACRCG